VWIQGRDLDYIEPPEIPKNLWDYLISFTKEYKREAIPQLSTDSTQFYTQGSRDDDLFRAANTMYRGGMDLQMVYETITILAKNCDPPFEDKALKVFVEQAIKQALKRERVVSEAVEEWVLSTTGYFFLREVRDALHLHDEHAQKNIHLILQRLIERGLLEHDPVRHGCYRVLDTEIMRIDWASADDNPFDIVLPLGLNDIWIPHPKNIVIVAGYPNSGKTAFCLETARLNMTKRPVYYFSYEMGGHELKSRLKLFRTYKEDYDDWLKVNFVERNYNWCDVIVPDQLNIVDYIPVPDEAYRITAPIRKIFEKLTTGLCIIALQKKGSTDLARGGEGTLDLARLYLSMGIDDRGDYITKITKIKNCVDPQFSPHGKSRSYIIHRGCEFEETSQWYDVQSGEIRK
jgi:hypothetical protein